MKCPKCGGKTTVVDTVTTDTDTYRYKQCKECKRRFCTVERITPKTLEFIEAYAANRSRYKQDHLKKERLKKNEDC